MPDHKDSSTAAALSDTNAAKLNASLYSWSQEELAIVLDVLDNWHLASARTIHTSLLKRLPGTKKKPRDVETLLERIVRYSVGADTSEASASASTAAADENCNSMEAFLCLLDDLMPGGLDFSVELADVLIESASNASGQLAEAYLFLASLLDGRPAAGLYRLSKSACRRLLNMLTEILASAKSATEQSDYLYRLLGLAHTSATLPRAIGLRDRLQTLLRMPLSLKTETATEQDEADKGGWLSSRLAMLANYADYSVNPLNLPDQLLASFPGVDERVDFNLTPGDGGGQASNSSLMRRYMASRAGLARRVLLSGLCYSESDEEEPYRRVSAAIVTEDDQFADAKRLSATTKKKSNQKQSKSSASMSQATRSSRKRDSSSKPVMKGARSSKKLRFEDPLTSEQSDGAVPVENLSNTSSLTRRQSNELPTNPTSNEPLSTDSVQISAEKQQANLHAVEQVVVEIVAIESPPPPPPPPSAEISTSDSSAAPATPIIHSIAQQSSSLNLNAKVGRVCGGQPTPGKENSSSRAAVVDKPQTVRIDPLKVNLNKFMPRRVHRVLVPDLAANSPSASKSTTQPMTPTGQSGSAAFSGSAAPAKPTLDAVRKLQMAPTLPRGRARTYGGNRPELTTVNDLLQSGLVKRVGPKVQVPASAIRVSTTEVTTTAAAATPTQ